MLQNAIQYNFSKLDEIRKICMPVKSYLGINLVNYRRFYINGNLLNLFNHLDWMKIAFEKKYWYSSTFFIKLNLLSGRKSFYYLWPEKPLQSDPIHCELYKRNIWNGFTIYKKNIDYIESYLFFSPNENKEIFFSEIAALEHFIFYFKNKIFSLVDKVEKNILIPCKLDVKNYHEENESKTKFFEDTRVKYFYLRCNGINVKFSKREFQCLTFIAHGKKIKEIAQILSLSPRTVEAYLDNIKLKAGCDTKSQVLSLYQQQVEPVLMETWQ